MIEQHSHLTAWFKVICCSLAIVTFATSTASATPIPTNNLDFNNLNGIRYYNAAGVTNCVVGVGSYSGETSAGLSSTQAGFVDAYHDIAAQLSVEYGIPWETVMAQGILESAAGTSKFATERNNFFGIGAFDSNPNNAFSYDTPEAGWRGYYENIRKTPTYRNHGVFQGDNITNPYTYLATIKASGYATDPNYINKVSQFITAILNRAEEKGWQTTADLANEHPELLTNAERYANGEATINTMESYTSGACIVQYSNKVNGGDDEPVINQGNGSINETALNLAWPDRSHNYNDPRPTYYTALQATGFTTYQTSDADVKRGSSCDVFVSTVMRYSGVDPEFPRFLGTGSSSGQEAYMKNSSKYQYVGTADNSAIAQPGDIRITNGHVTLVVRREDGSLGIADASHTGQNSPPRTAGIRSWYNDSSFRLYRHI